jgi:small subunit ribosomal protein S20
MAKRIRSAIKKHRQSIKRKIRNVQVRSALKTLVKDLNAAIELRDLAKSREFLKLTIAALGRASSKGVIHKKTASRTSGRLSKRVHSLSINSEQSSS